MYRRKRLQNRIAESRYTLPVTALYSIVIWLAGGLINRRLWLPFALMVVNTYLMVELNNRNALMRIYSRMVSCSFLILTVMTSFLFDQTTAWVIGICSTLTYLLLFNAYQDKGATRWAFYAFLVIGIASLFFIQILYYVPILWILFGSKIMGLSWRTFWASLLGLVLPYWFYGGYSIYTNSFKGIAGHFAELGNFQGLLQIENLSSYQIFTFIFIALLGITGIIHFARSTYKDKIRTRMLYEIFSTMAILTMVFVLLQPRLYNQLLPILIVNTAPLIAHFIALSHTKASNISFCVLSVIALALTVYNLWGPSLTF